MPKTRRVCGNCGSLQGPYDRVFVGFRKTGHYIFTCRVPIDGPDGKRLTDKKRADIAAACNARRDRRYATAQKNNA